MLQNGIHHVAAIAGPAQRNLDLYTRILGLRLVKKTVNFDDPGTYHFYYGDEAGQPGTILTFFPWAPGRLGTGETQETVFRVPESAIGRLAAKGCRMRAEKPRLFPGGLLPRAGRHSVRDRHGRSGLRGRRAGREPRPLKLPRFLEPRREAIEAVLPKVT